MQNRLVTTLQTLRQREETGLAPFLMAGDGGLERTRSLLHVIERAGASCCEVGVPFSDPIADGPVLQAAADRALSQGTTLGALLDTVQQYRQEGGQMALALMSYVNPLLAHGLANLCKDAKRVGIDALIVPDLPPSEAIELRELALACEIGMVFFAAPTSPSERIELAAQASTGFLYVVGRTGVTGASTRWDRTTLDYLARVRDLVPQTPRAVGFGLSTPHDIQTVAPYTDLAIVGSAFVAAVARAGNDHTQALDNAKTLVTDLVRAGGKASRGA